MGIDRLQEEYAEFKEKRDWEKFHEPKNIAMSISIEASELMEHFQWKDNVPVKKIKQDEELMAGVREELADVILYSLSMAQRLDIDIEKAVLEKLEENRERFDEGTAEEITKELDEWIR
ncbi:MAG: nucleotide pyrophosphohydrolase [Candidatus Nanohalobium sp.]